MDLSTLRATSAAVPSGTRRFFLPIGTDMELRQLHTFRTVAAGLSISRAAEELNYAQSSVTAQIQSLEREIGAPLFDRVGRRLELTLAGTTLVGYAARIDDLVSEAAAALRAPEEPEGTLVVGSAESLCTYRLPPLLHAFGRAHPKVRLEIRTGEHSEQVAALRAGKLDLNFSLDEPIHDPDLEAVPLVREPIVVVAPAGHPLAARARVTPRELARESMVMTESDCTYRRLFEVYLQRAHARPRPSAEFNSIEAIKQCVAAGLGVAVLPQIAVQRELDEGALAVLHVPLRTNLWTQLVTRTGSRLAPARAAFADLAIAMLGVPARG